MRKTSALLLTFSFSIAALIGGCMDSNDNLQSPMTDTPIILSLNELGDNFSKRYPDLVHVTHQPSGISFYKARWNHRAKGRIKIVIGNRALHADDVLYLTGTQQKELISEGISTVDISSGITGPTGISHEAARDYFYAVLLRLRNDGWKTSIPFSAPRLRGKHLINCKIETGRGIPLDADYKPTLEEWIKLDNLSAWELYTDNAFLIISFQRSPNPKDPSGPGAYLVNYELNSSINHFKNFVDPLKRNDWKILLPDELKEISAKRRATEAALSEKGIPIDTDYVDPPIPW